MVVCKFFLQGNCRYGANCRYEHPAGQGGTGGSGGGGGGGFGQNRFGALSNTNTGTNRFGGTVDNSKAYNLNLAEVKLDLTRGSGRPQWVLSTYGAGKSTPASLFEGNEFSPEEIRVRFYDLAGKGQEVQADQEAIQLWTKAEQELDNAANHVDDVSKFMEEAEKKHPNRYDFLKTDGTRTRDELAKAAEASNATSSGFGTSNAFGQSSNANPFAKPAAATFGQPSAPSAFGASSFGKPAQPSAFGQPAFGQSGFGASSPALGQTNTATSAFGQPSNTSAFGQPASASAFGKPAFGQSGFGQSAFGQPAQPSITSAFGQATQSPTQSAFGQISAASAFGQSAFGQPAKPNPFAAPSASAGFGGSSSTFGQPAQTTSAFGQPSQQTPAFGQASQPAPAFGQASKPTSGFGQSAFGQPAQSSGFGQSAFGQPAQSSTNSPFGQAARTNPGFGIGSSNASPFGQNTQQNASPFASATQPKSAEVSMEADTPATILTPATGSTSSFATLQPSANANPFGTPQSSTPLAQSQPTAPAAAPSPAQPSNSTSQTPNSLTSKPPKPLHYTQTLPVAPSQTNMTKRLIQYRNQRVEYLGDDANEVPCYNRPDGKGPEKIWFPDAGAAPEVVALNREDKIADLQEESDKYTEEVRQQFAFLFDEGRFRDGKIPLVPPMREWCLYDF